MPTTQPTTTDQMHWWKVSGIFALLIALITGISLSLPREQGIVVLVIAVVAFTIAICFNPRFRFMRAAVSITSAWLAARGFPTIIGVVSTDDHLLAFSFFNTVGFSFDLSCAVVACLLFWLDYRTRNPQSPSRQVVRLGRLFSPQRQQGENISQQVQTGDVVGDNNQIQIHNVEAKQDLNPEIDDAASYLKQGRPDIAITHLEKLKRHKWDHMTDRERFRVLANLGHAHRLKDESDEAAKYFIDAKAWQEHDETALALESLAHLLVEDDPKARSLAQDVLKRFPNSEIATSVLIQTSSDEEPLGLIEEGIPVPLRNSEEVLSALFATALRRDAIDRALALARQLVSIDQNALLNKEALGAALVRKAVLVRQGAVTASTVEIRSNLDEAIELLKPVVESDLIASRQIKARARYYRAVAFDFTDRPQLAEAEFRAALESSPTNSTLLFQFGIFLVTHNRETEAVEVLERASTPDGDFGPDVLRARLLSESDQASDQDIAITLLDSLPSRLEVADEGVRFEAIGTMLEVYLKLRDREAADSCLNNMEDKLSKASFLTLAAVIAHRADDKPAAASLAEQDADAIEDNTPVVVSSFLGHLLAQLKQFDLGLKVLRAITTPQSFDQQIILTLECAREADDLRFIVGFCKDLRADQTATPFTIDTELATLDRLGDFGTALNIIDEYLKAPTDMEFARVLRVRKSLIGKKLGRTELIEYELDKLPDVASVSIPVGCIVATLLSEGPAPMDGVLYAYELSRIHFDDPRPSQCLVAIVGIGVEHAIQLPAFDTVQAGCAVHYTENDGGDQKWVIIEDSPNPNSTRGEIKPDSPLAKELFGKAVEDDFFLRHDVVQDRTATITAIVHKVAYRKLDIIENWEDRFPDTVFVRKYKFAKTPSGDPDVAAFMKSIERLHESRKEIDRLVQQHPLSAANYSRLSQTSILESVLHLSHQEELPLRCCRGADDERNEAIRVAAASSIVLEGSALVTLYWTGVFDKLSRLPCNTMVTEGTLNIFRELLVEKHARFWSKRFVTVGNRGAVFDERSDQAVADAKARMQAFVTWIEHQCDVKSATSLADLSPEKRTELVELLGDEAVEAVALATSEGLPIWTDDFGVADITKDMITAGRVWSELMLDRCAEQNIIDDQEFCRFKLSLVDAGYHFTPLDSDMIDMSLEVAHWESDARPLSSVIRWLCTSNVNLLGCIQLGSYILKKAQQDAPLAQQKTSISRRVVENLAARTDGPDALRTLHSCLSKIFGLDALSKQECAAIIQQEFVQRARQRRIILPGDSEWNI